MCVGLMTEGYVTVAWSKVCRLWMCLFCVCGVLACTGKPYTPPYSEIIAQAESEGREVKSVEEQRELFFRGESIQRRRLLSLLRVRSEGSSRDKNYRIGPEDEIEINVFDVEELNVASRVRPSGYLSLPLLGAVKAQGLTESELQAELTKRLKTYVKDPQVSVFISHYGSQRVAVMGSVHKPGTYSLTKGANSLLELISRAGGLDQHAGGYITFIPAEISGISANSDIEARARLSLASYESGELRDSGIQIYLDHVLGTSGGIPLEVPVRGGDMVVVGAAGTVMVEGEVQKPGEVKLGRRMTVLGALAGAGGLTYAAKPDELEIVRETGVGQRVHLLVDLQELARGEASDVRLRDGDIVRIPTDADRHMTRNTMEALSRIVNVGVGTTYSP